MWIIMISEGTEKSGPKYLASDWSETFLITHALIFNDRDYALEISKTLNGIVITYNKGSII